MRSSSSVRPFGIVTGASSGIGFELALLCAREGFDLLVAAERPEIQGVAEHCRGLGAESHAVQADLSTPEGVEQLLAAAEHREVDLLIANAGRALSQAFLDQNFSDVRCVVDTNVTGTVLLLQRVGRGMRARGRGRILITGSIAASVPGPFNAVYNASKAFLNSFAAALRAELDGSGVIVTCLLPGLTDTEIFTRAGMDQTLVGAMTKADPADVARDGFEAVMRGDASVVSGWTNKVIFAASQILPAGLGAGIHRIAAEPRDS